MLFVQANLFNNSIYPLILIIVKSLIHQLKSSLTNIHVFGNENGPNCDQTFFRSSHFKNVVFEFPLFASIDRKSPKIISLTTLLFWRKKTYIYWSKNYGKNNMLGCHSICYLPGVYADLVWYHLHHIFCPQLILNKINIIWWDYLNRQILISREKKISKMSSPSWRWTATAITGAINLPKWTLIEKWWRSINTINTFENFWRYVNNTCC